MLHAHNVDVSDGVDDGDSLAGYPKYLLNYPMARRGEARRGEAR